MGYRYGICQLQPNFLPRYSFIIRLEFTTIRCKTDEYWKQNRNITNGETKIRKLSAHNLTLYINTHGLHVQIYVFKYRQEAWKRYLFVIKLNYCPFQYNVIITKFEYVDCYHWTNRMIKGAISDWYCSIILAELMYIVFVSFDWTRALSRVCFWFVHTSMNFFVFDPFITRWTFWYNQYKQYGGRRQESTIVSDWKQAWKSV